MFKRGERSTPSCGLFAHGRRREPRRGARLSPVFRRRQVRRDANGQPLQFCKENHSNGCIGTSDVFYPMAPQFLLFGPTLAKSFLVPFMNYAASERWKFPFAPHDLGTYPHANGQVYGGGERNEQNQMPVEESGNLLILFSAIARWRATPISPSYTEATQQWAEYLKAKGSIREPALPGRPSRAT